MTTTMAVDKIRQIGQDILDEPRRFNMARFLAKSPLGGRYRPPCGTTACFAGEWAIRYLGVDPSKPALLSELEDKLGGPSATLVTSRLANACQEDLGLPDQCLFFDSNWPSHLSNGLDRFTPGTRAYAHYFVEEVLEDYIRTNGWTSTGKENRE